MAEHSSVEKILISVTEYERLKEMEQKYLSLQNPGRNT
jgi:PHD/YefM family antitoxin component YafN of YafNO toxin-antitoxin module